MELQYTDRKNINQFSAFSADFSNDQSQFSAFIQQPFHSVNDFTEQAKLKSKNYSAESRKTLTDNLEKQLSGFLSEKQTTNLELLKDEKTFTVTTGHQLTLFGGPLFMVYKVMHVVKLAEDFNTSQNEFKAVPVFWMASEDHDIDEIRSANLFNKTLAWNTEKTGAAGRLPVNEMQEVTDELRAFFANNPDAEMLSLISDLPQENYGKWYQQYISKLFSDYGVLVIEPDSREFKQLFLPVIEREIIEMPSLPAVGKMNRKLEEAGLKPQAQARGCNLFLLDEGGRYRIDPAPNGFSAAGKVYSEEQLLEMARQHPESFSPNVILRPVYQETILPNLAYIGGGGEMAYWIQLKSVFEAQETVFPLIQQRNSLMLVDPGTKKRIEKMGWTTERFFAPKEQLRSVYLKENSEESLDMSAINKQFGELRLTMIQKAKSIDVGLESYAEAETVRMEKQLESFGQKLLKQVKQQHEQSLKGIDGVSDRLFPAGTLQERYFHWLQFAPDGNYKKLLEQIYEATSPFEGKLITAEL